MNWTIIGSLAGVIGAAAAVVFGLMPLARDRRFRRGGSAVGMVDQKLSGMLLPPPALDVQVRGRDDVIAEMTKLVTAPDGRVKVLAGMGGCGKSTVARAVAARVKSAGGRAWWVSATDATSVTQLLLGLAGELGASADQVEAAAAGRVNPSDLLWRQLETVHDWLLVLDNADDLAALVAGGRPAVSGAGWLRTTQAGLVLVTSRMLEPQAWGPVADICLVELLNAADGAQGRRSWRRAPGARRAPGRSGRSLRWWTARRVRSGRPCLG